LHLEVRLAVSEWARSATDVTEEIAIVVVAGEWLGFPMLLDDAVRSGDYRADEKD
jgi:hypothetical protein